MRNALALAACLLLFVPAVTAADDAQSPLTIREVSILDPPMPYAGNATVTVTLGVGCATLAPAIVPAAQKATATIGVSDAPTWLTVTGVGVDFVPADCTSTGTPPSGYVIKTGQVGLKVAPEAPGVLPQTITFTAGMEAQPARLEATPFAYGFNVSYHANHTITSSMKFPATLTGGYLNFTVTVNYGANAPGMVMFENLKATTGSISGLASSYFLPAATKTFQVSYKAPATPWNQTTVSFHAYSHLLINGTSLAGTPQLAQDYSWVILNGNPDGSPDGKPSPMGGWPLFAVLGLAAMVASRRSRRAA